MPSLHPPLPCYSLQSLEATNYSTEHGRSAGLDFLLPEANWLQSLISYLGLSSCFWILHVSHKCPWRFRDNATVLGIATRNISSCCQWKPLRTHIYASIGSTKRDPTCVIVAPVCFIMKIVSHPYYLQPLSTCSTIFIYFFWLRNASNSPEELQNPAEERGALQPQFKDAGIRVFIFR